MVDLFSSIGGPHWRYVSMHDTGALPPGAASNKTKQPHGKMQGSASRWQSWLGQFLAVSTDFLQSLQFEIDVCSVNSNMFLLHVAPTTTHRTHRMHSMHTLSWGLETRPYCSWQALNCRAQCRPPWLSQWQGRAQQLSGSSMHVWLILVKGTICSEAWSHWAFAFLCTLAFHDSVTGLWKINPQHIECIECIGSGQGLPGWSLSPDTS